MMKIGFTYDLRDDYLAQGFSLEEVAEFDTLETIEFIEAALQANGYAVERIGGIKPLVSALAAGRRWDIVFNICEGLKGIGREAQVPALLEAYDIPCVFSSSDVMVLTMNKAVAKYAVREQGIPTAPCAVVERIGGADAVDLPFPVFVKPLAEGTGKGITEKSLVTDRKDLGAVCDTIIRTFNQPALVETYLPGRDLTVGVLGAGDSARVVGVMETRMKDGAEQGGQSFYNKENCEKVLEYALIDDKTAKAAAQVALSSWKALGCVDGGRVDLRCDEKGVPNFLEVNPMAGLHPTHSDLPILAGMVGMDHVTLIGEIMTEALSRNGLSFPAALKKAG